MIVLARSQVKASRSGGVVEWAKLKLHYCLLSGGEVERRQVECAYLYI